MSSLSSGVNTAIELYLKELKRAEYDEKMAEASKDKEFLTRTMECHREIDENDGVVLEKW